MKFPRSVPTPVFISLLVFLLLLFGGYFASRTDAISSQPVYLTGSTGGTVANINNAGHLSVHVADGGLPAFTGPLGSRHMSFPIRQGLSHGECYAAYIRGGGSFESGSVTFNHGTGSGTPQILVRIDSDPVWLEGRQGATPAAASTGVSHSGNTYVFGFPYSLSFKAFAGTLLCWHGHGRSDSFSVQMTIANGGGGPYDPEEMLFQPTGNNGYRWNHLQGPVPYGFELHGTDSTIVSYYGANHPLAPELFVVNGQPLVKKQTWFSATISQAVINSSYFGGKTPIRYYVFEVQPTGTTPTRVGPFGNWTGE